MKTRPTTSDLDGTECSPLHATNPAEPETDIDVDTYATVDATSVLAAARSRIVWLGLFLVGLWAAAFVIDAFEHMLQRNVELAHFVPLIIGHGGNAGSQAVGQVIKALVSKDVNPRSRATAVRVVAKEALVGVLCGGALGLVLLAVGLATRIVSVHVGTVVAISLPLVSLWANTIGAALPLAAARLGSNPALTSAPMMTTVIDSSGLLIYFVVAHLYFGGQDEVHLLVDKHHAWPHHHHHHHHRSQQASHAALAGG